jgi:hypothetical protein
MSGEHAKKEMETGDKPTTSHGKTSLEESRKKGKGKEKKASSHKSHRSGYKKKKIRKVVYYETDTSSPSTSGPDAPSVTSKRHECKKFSKIPLRYPHIPKHTPLLFVPLGKPPTFDGEDYARWSDLMRFHLTSLHKSIWDVVKFGVQVPSVGDEDYDEDEWPKSSTSTPKPCWGLVLKCYESRTRKHKILNVNVLRPSKHYFPKDIMIFGRRL